MSIHFSLLGKVFDIRLNSYELSLMLNIMPDNRAFAVDRSSNLDDSNYVFSSYEFICELSDMCIQFARQKKSYKSHRYMFARVLRDVCNRKGLVWDTIHLKRAKTLVDQYPDIAHLVLHDVKISDSSIDLFSDDIYSLYFEMGLAESFHSLTNDYSDCTDSSSISDESELDDLPLHYVDQSGEDNYKDSCRKKFKIRNASGKRKIEKIKEATKKLTKNELKKLISSLSKSTIQAGEDLVGDTGLADTQSVDMLKEYFKDFPFGYNTLLEIIRTAVGIKISVNPTQIIFHILSSAFALGMNHASGIRDIISNLFMGEQTGSDWHEKFVDTLKYWKDNSILSSIKKGILILISLGFSQVSSLNKYLPSLQSMLGDPKLLKLDSFDILSFAMSVYIFISERIGLAFQQKSLWGFFTPIPRLTDLTTRIDAVHALSPYVLSGRVEEIDPGITVESFANQVHNLAAETRSIMVTCLKSEKVLVMSWHRKLVALGLQLEVLLGEPALRNAPFTLNYIGTSGVGKTMLIPLMAKASLSAYGKVMKKGDCYYRTPTDKFWSGYHGQPVVVENEKNSTPPQYSETNENKTTLDISDNAIMYLNMADVDSKGVYTMRSDVYIMTTNRASAQAELTSNEPAAVLRRSLHVVVEVKDEFKRPGSDMIDTSKVHGDPLTDDAWLFTVMDVQTIPNSNLGVPSGWEWVICKDESGRYMNKVPLHDLLIYIRYRATLHIQRQRIILKNYDNMHSTELCPHGSGSSICRLCNNLPDPPKFKEIVRMGNNIKNWTEVSQDATVLFTSSMFENQSGVVFMLPVFFSGFWLCKLFNWLEKYWITRYLFAIGRARVWNWLLSLLSVFDWVGAEKYNNGSVTLYKATRMLLMNKRMTKHGLKSVGDHGFLLHFLLCCVYYLFFPTVIYCFMGCGVVASLAFGDGCALVLNSSIFAFYKRLHDRGAADSLKDWAIMKAKPYLTTKFNYIAFASIVSGALIAYKVLNSRKFVEQGGSHSSLWSDDRAWNIPYEAPKPSTEQQRTTTAPILAELVSKHVSYVRIYQNGGTKCVCFNLIPFKSGFWIGPGHAFKDLKYDTMDIIFNSSLFGANIKQIPIDRDKLQFVENKDIAIVYIVQTAGFMKDMSSYFCNSVQTCAATYVYKQKDGTMLKEGGNMTRLTPAIGNWNLCREGYVGNAPFKTFEGLCGAAQVSHTKIPSIISMHIRGIIGRRDSICIPLVKDEIAHIVEQMCKDAYIIQTASFDQMDLTDGDSSKVISQRYHEKSPLGHLEQGHCKYFGTLPNRQKAVSAVKETIMSNAVREVMGVENIWGNPNNLRSWKPWFDVAASITNPIFKDPTDLNLALKDYYDPILERFNCGSYKHIVPLDEQTILSGHHSSGMYKHMDIKRSTGYPLHVPKSTFIKPVYYSDDIDTPWHFEMDDILRGRINDIVKRCEAGLRPNCIYATAMKVESKTLFTYVNGEKTPKYAKPRIFYPAPIELVYLCRKYFMPVENILKDFAECEYAIGINVLGPDWTTLVKSLQEKGDNNMPADQKGYDQSITPDEFMPHLAMQIYIAKNFLGYSAHDIMMMEKLSSCIVYPIINFDSDLCSFLSIHGSGGVFTAQYNSKINSIRHRMPFFRHLRNHNLSLKFRDYVCLWTYGDDSLPSVHDDIKYWYNLVEFAKYWSRYGVIVTDAMKGDDLVPIIPLSQCDFLKRSFRYDLEREVWTAPLSEASIFKRLHTYIPSSVLSDEEQCGEAISTSLRDYFEFGREVYNMKKEQLEKIAELSNLTVFVPRSFPTYDEVLEDYNQKHLGMRPPAVMRG